LIIESEPEPALSQDRELCEAARSGDQDALEKLLLAHYDRVHALCRRMLGDDDDAEDATQETLLLAVRSLSRFDGRSSFGTWIYRIATNACIDELRRRRRRPLAGLDHDVSGGTERAARDGALGPRPGEDPAESAARRMDVDSALSSLPVEFRAAVVLRDLCDLTYEEIARVVGVPVGTVRSRIARGRAALADLLGDRRNPREPLNVESGQRRGEITNDR
jgi:RNA polymerase sigma-70 factor (ECF subfamily)